MRTTWFSSRRTRAVAFVVVALFTLAVTRRSAPWNAQQPGRGFWNGSGITSPVLPFMPNAEHFRASKTAELARQAYARMPISFEMVDYPSQPDIKFKARGNEYSISFTKKTVELSLRDGTLREVRKQATVRSPGC